MSIFNLVRFSPLVPLLRGNELTQSVFWSLLKIPNCGCVCCARQFPCVIPTAAAACKHASMWAESEEEENQHHILLLLFHLFKLDFPILVSRTALFKRNISYIAAPTGRMRYSNREFCHSPSKAGLGLNQRTE